MRTLANRKLYCPRIGRHRFCPCSPKHIPPRLQEDRRGKRQLVSRVIHKTERLKEGRTAFKGQRCPRHPKIHLFLLRHTLLLHVQDRHYRRIHGGGIVSELDVEGLPFRGRNRQGGFHESVGDRDRAGEIG